MYNVLSESSSQEVDSSPSSMSLADVRRRDFTAMMARLAVPLKGLPVNENVSFDRGDIYDRTCE